LKRLKPRKEILDLLELDEGDPGFQVLTEEEIATVILFSFFSSALPILLNFSFFLRFSFVLWLSFVSLIRISESLLYNEERNHN
jgi:hypothetical protein